MQSRWIAAGAGIAGIVLAFIVIRSPDTGGEVIAPTSKLQMPEQPGSIGPIDPTPPTAAAAGEPEPPTVPPGTMTRPGLPPPIPIDEAPRDVIPGPNPLAREALEKRSQPEAVISGKASIPWTLIRRNLNRVENEDAKELSELSNQLVLDLRRMRRDPDTFDYGEIEQRQRELQGRIKSGGFNSDQEIDQMLTRVDEILNEYHTLNK